VVIVRIASGGFDSRRAHVGVSINWLSGPAITSDAGGFRGIAIFSVPRGANGVIVQQVTIGKQSPYWEAWTVTNGVVSPGDMTSGNDSFSAPSAAYSPETGLLQFYPGSTMASFPELQIWNVPSAQDLDSSTIQPANWTSAGALLHQVVVTPTSSGYSITGTPNPFTFR
jgi:hypothetical protein